MSVLRAAAATGLAFGFEPAAFGFGKSLGPLSLSEVISDAGEQFRTDRGV